MPTPPEIVASLEQCPDDPDALVLVHMVKAGADLLKPHHPEFAFDVARRESAEALAEELSASGYEVAVYEPDDTISTYEVVAQKVMVLELREMNALTVQFEALASQHNASYDGWGAEIVE